MIETDLQKKIAALKEKKRNEGFLTNYNLITENEEEFNKHSKELTQAIENLKRLSEAIKAPEESEE